MQTQLPGASPPAARPPQPPHDELTFNTTPNLLTLLRMALVPVVVWLLTLREPRWDIASAAIFGIASITDYFDGYIARTRNIVTVYGKLMDPLADKFLVVSALITLQDLGRIPFYIVILLICREIAITGLRALASAEGLIISSSSSAKWKTATQMVAIPLLILKDNFFHIPLYSLGQWLIYISLGLSLWTGGDYIVDFIRALREMRKARAAKRSERKSARKAGKLRGKKNPN